MSKTKRELIVKILYRISTVYAPESTVHQTVTKGLEKLTVQELNSLLCMIVTS